MKKILKMAAIMLIGAMITTSCNTDGYKKTKSGLVYKFIECNKDAQQLKIGDVLVGTCTMRLDDSILFVVDAPDRIMMVNETTFPGDLNEGLQMMHLGDKCIIGVSADSLHKYGMQFPAFYKENAGMRLYYEINLTDIISQEEMRQEREVYFENLRQAQEAEAENLANYVKKHNIKATPDEDGLYIIVNKKGNGQKVEIGRNVAINYTGKLLDGKVFDTSVEKVAKENGLYVDGRKYTPLEYRVGDANLIQGWQKGVINQPAGTKLTLIMPSSLAYGPVDNGPIPANSSLIFDIEIVSVN